MTYCFDMPPRDLENTLRPAALLDFQTDLLMDLIEENDEDILVAVRGNYTDEEKEDIDISFFLMNAEEYRDYQRSGGLWTYRDPREYL